MVVIVVVLALALITRWCFARWSSAKAELFACDGSTLNKGFLHAGTTISPGASNRSRKDVFTSTTDVMRNWLISIHPELSTYASKMVKLGYTDPQRVLTLDDTALEDLAHEAGILDDVQSRLFVEGVVHYRTSTRIASSTYTTLYKTNAGCARPEGSPSGYRVHVTADPEEEAHAPDSSAPSYKYFPVEMGDRVWAKYNDADGRPSGKWAEARVTGVYARNTLPHVPTAQDVSANKLMQESQQYANDFPPSTTEFVYARGLTSYYSIGATDSQPSRKPFNYFYAVGSNDDTSNDASYPVRFPKVSCVTLHLEFLDDSRWTPTDTLSAMGDERIRAHDLRVRAKDVRRHPPQAVIDEVMLQCAKGDSTARFVTIGCKAVEGENHSRHVFEGVCSARCDSVNRLRDVEATGAVSDVYEKDDATLSQSMLGHVLNGCVPSTGHTQAKRTCPVATATVVANGDDQASSTVVPTACPCAASSLNAAEVQDFLNRHLPREIHVGPQCHPKGPSPDGDDITVETSCPGQYDIPCRQRPEFTDSGEPFCTRIDTPNHQCAWYTREDALEGNVLRQHSPTMTGCYDADACLFLDEGKCEDNEHKGRCKWKTDWAQCVPRKRCPTKKPVTVDDFRKMTATSGPYQRGYDRIQKQQKIQADQTQLDESTNAIYQQYSESILKQRLGHLSK